MIHEQQIDQWKESIEADQLLKKCLLYMLQIFFPNLWDLSSLTRDQTCTSQHWQCRILTSGLPGKFQTSLTKSQGGISSQCKNNELFNKWWLGQLAIHLEKNSLFQTII